MTLLTPTRTRPDMSIDFGVAASKISLSVTAGKSEILEGPPLASTNGSWAKWKKHHSRSSRSQWHLCGALIISVGNKFERKKGSAQCGVKFIIFCGSFIALDGLPCGGRNSLLTDCNKHNDLLKVF